MNPRRRSHHGTRENKCHGASEQFDRRKAIKSINIAVDILYAYSSIIDNDDSESNDVKKAIRGLDKIKDYLGGR